MEDMVRLQKILIENVHNVEKGEIKFACYNKGTQCENAPSSDIMGIYGQNGSGKTALINALELLKTILSGESFEQEAHNYISQGKDNAKLSCEFLVKNSNNIYCVKYEVLLGKYQKQDRIANKISWTLCVLQEQMKYSPLPSLSARTTELVRYYRHEGRPLYPKATMEKLTKNDVKRSDNLRVACLLAQRAGTSFCFSDDFLTFLQHDAPQPFKDIFFQLHKYGHSELYVIGTRGWGPINLNMGLPLYFRVFHKLNDQKERLAMGSVLFNLNGSTEIPRDAFEPIQHAVSVLNPVLEKIIPGLQLELREIGSPMQKDGSEGVVIEPIALRDGKRIALRFESEGIKKLVAILNMFIAAYNSPSFTLAIDELDAGIYEYLLGELLSIFDEGGKGQLIFTAHNLRPLEKLDKQSIICTTTNPQNRYIKLRNIKKSNNTRDVYYRAIILGGQSEELYSETNNAAIRFALWEAAGEKDG